MIASKRIFGLLGELVNDRVYPLFVPETADSTPPFMVYTLVSNVPDNTLDGITGHEWVGVQIDIYAADYDETIELAQEAVKRLNTIKPSEYGGVVYVHDDGLYRAIIEYEFWQTLPD